MKKLKFISVFLVVAVLLQILSPVALASQNFDMNDVCRVDNIWAYGVEDSEMIYNLLVDTDKNSGQFAVKYKESPDTVYELVFDLGATDDVELASFWIATIERCFDNESAWSSTNISNAVQIVESNPSGISLYAADAYVTYFTNYLIGQYGAESYDYELRSTTEYGVTMTQYQAKLHRAGRDRTYLITAALTVAGFITGVLGAVIGDGIVAAISFILGSASLFTIGEKVYEYSLFTNWSRYITINGGSYPYNMTDKFIMYTGYVYTATGNYAVDEASEQTLYSDSYAYYLRYTLQFEDAYAEYQRIGWQG